MKPKILSVRIEHNLDEDPDTSWLGRFTNDATAEAIIRIGEHAGKFVSELGEDDDLPSYSWEYRFFLPAMTGEETGNPESLKQDWQRMESLNAGDWHFISVIAKAEFQLTGIIQTICSGGLWGVESDSGKDYLADVACEELAELKVELLALGFKKRAIEYAFKNCENL